MSTLKTLAVVGAFGLIGSIALSTMNSRKHDAADSALGAPTAIQPCLRDGEGAPTATDAVRAAQPCK